MEAETNGSFDNYLRIMDVDREWLDSTMLYAMSGALGIAFMVFPGTSEPWLVSCATLDGRPNTPILSIACAHEFHFWALYVQEEPDQPDAQERHTYI